MVPEQTPLEAWVPWGLGGDRMADDRLICRDFMALARTIGLPQGDADRAISELVDQLANAVGIIRQPDSASETEIAATAQGQVLALASDAHWIMAIAESGIRRNPRRSYLIKKGLQIPLNPFDPGDRLRRATG